ncbi:chromosome partitioning protein [Rhizobium leucaenae]|uniref:Chromosome partitioning protein n=1 Tax=Rhizobium leucaenae TaxID=29450 RepID=A0A7W6ZYV4_9HYPH|nr:chromosome partitioning protein [Rhizobium leucaenae]MBB6305318.1 chromosome partitioning protein [Rhizobium leucaenae]
MNMAINIEASDFDQEILQQGELISDNLNMLRLEQYPPDAEKGLRAFSLAEVADYLGVTQNHIKKLHLEGKGPVPATTSSGCRTYTAEQMLELRHFLDKNGRTDFKRYVPHRREHLQIVSEPSISDVQRTNVQFDDVNSYGL